MPNLHVRAADSTVSTLKPRTTGYPTNLVLSPPSHFLLFDEELGPTRLPGCLLYFLGSFRDILTGSRVPTASHVRVSPQCTGHVLLICAVELRQQDKSKSLDGTISCECT
jgi:hypothetical protein